MMPAIHPQTIQQRQNPALPQFNEGAASTANKVVAFVAALIASIASFFLLPFEGALLTSLGTSMLASMFACQGTGAAEQPSQGWFQTALNLVPLFGRTSQPVVQPGPRVIVGSGHELQAPVIMAPSQVHLARRHPNAVHVGLSSRQQQQPVFGSQHIHVRCVEKRDP